MTVHQRFAAWVASKGWSQHDAAREIGVSQAFVSGLMSGNKTVAGLAIALRIEELSRAWSAGPICAREWVHESGTGTEVA